MGKVASFVYAVALAVIRIASTDTDICGSPPDVRGAVTPQLKTTEHPLGTAILYNCPLAYIPLNICRHISVCKSNKETGRAEWTVPEITCNPRSCGDPGYLNNGRRIGNLFTFSNKVDYECEEGYKLRGLKSRYCQADGEWSGRLPSCKPIYCNVPADPVNGRVVFSSREYGTELKYECNAGFILKNHQARMCSEDGSWSYVEPECIEAMCEEPQPPKHGTVKLHGDLKVNTLATYSCDPDRKLYGTTATKCMASGKWTFDAPECLESCIVPFIENGAMGSYEIKHTGWGRLEEFKKVLVGENVDSRETLILRCNNGALPADNSEILHNNRLQVTCNDGTWSKDLQCKQTRCLGEPPPSKNARAVIISREHGFIIYYICATRDAPKIQGNVTCHFGSWIGIPPKCLNHPCYTIDLNYPGLVKPPEEHFDTSENFEIHCENGYRKQARVQKISCQRGKWDISQSPCTFDEEESIIKPTTEEVHIPHGGEIEPSVNVESSSPPTIDVNRNRECFCNHEFDDSVKAELGNKTLRRSDRIKRGETVSLKCNSESKFLTWQNGFRFYGNASMTCNKCRKWQREDLPTCSRPSGDTFISYDGDLKILPGGIIGQPRGETRRYICTSDVYPPVWNHGDREDVRTFTYQHTDLKRNIWFMSILDITGTGNKHNGEYKCFIRGDHGNPVGSTNFYLQVHDNPVCASPPPIDGTITSELKGSEHALGTTVTYNCPLGYVSRNSANHTSVCEINEVTGKAEWIAPEITCNPRSCGDPGYLNNGRRIGDLFFFPNRVEYECEEGYKLRGLKSRYCQAGGEWSGRLPSCEPISCNVPADPVNGRVVYSSREYGTELKYECNAGFILKNHQVRKCSEDGSWSNEEPECIESTCEEPQPPKHGTVKLQGDLDVGSLATYSCDPDRKLYGATTRECLISGKWTFDAPECLRSCSVPFIENGEMGRYNLRRRWRSKFTKVLVGENVDSRETLIFRCENGALPVENSQFLDNNRLQVTCSDGTWSKDLQCKQKPCFTRDLNYPGLVKPPEEHFNSFENFEINCETGYRRQSRDQKITCVTGNWNISQNPCTFGVQQCLLNLDPSSHLVVDPKKDGYRMGDFIFLSCPLGEEMSKKVERLMCMGDRWSDSLPECIDLENKDQR